MRFLPDTNVFIDWTVRRHPGIARQMVEHRAELALSSIVFHELYFGAFNSGRVERNLRVLDSLDMPVLDFDRDDARAAGMIRAERRRAGMPIGPHDVLIAGQALARGLTLVTANQREFARVDGLALADWTAG